MIGTIKSWTATAQARWQHGQRWLWEDVPAEEDWAGRLARRPFWWATFAFQGAFRKDLMHQSAGHAFWLMLSLIPFLALVFAIFKGFGVLELVQPFLMGALSAGQEELVPLITKYVEAMQTAALGGTGVIGLLVVGFTLLQGVKKTLNDIWHVENPPGYGQHLIEYLAVLAIAPVLVVLPLAASAMINSSAIQFALEGVPLMAGMRSVALEYSGVLAYGMILFYAYAFLPDAPVRWRHALFGALVAGTVLHFAQRFYIDIMFRVTNYNVVYGAMALLPFLMVWMFVGMLIFFVGAQLAYTSQQETVLLGLRRLSHHERSAQAHLALGLMVVLQLEFRLRTGPVPNAALSRRLGLPVNMVEGLAQRLRNSKLIAPAPGAAGHHVPARPADRITVAEVLEALQLVPVFPEKGPIDWDPVGLPLDALFQKANAALEKPLAKVTLAEIVDEVERKLPGPGLGARLKQFRGRKSND